MKTLGPLLHPAPGLLGALRLRGYLVPVFDLGAFTDRLSPGDRGTPEYAIVLRLGGRLLGLAVDEIEGLLQVEAEAVQPIGHGEPEGAVADDGDSAEDGMFMFRILRGSFLNGDRVVSVLDPERLFASPRILSVPTARAPGRSSGDGPIAGDGRSAGGAAPNLDALGRGAEPLLTFAAGGANFALLATAVHATVPRTTIDQNSLSGDLCIGSVAYHGRRIPVLRSQALTGLGRLSDTIESEIVLVRTGEEERIGLAVDTIDRMISSEADRLRPPPPAICEGRDLFRGVLADSAGGAQIFVLDADKLRDHPAIAALSALSRPAKSEPKHRNPRTDTRSDVVRDVVRHLVFDVGMAVAAPAEQILRILTRPKDLTPATSVSAPSVEGVFLLEDGPVLLVDLGAHLGLAEPSSAREEESRRVLLVRSGEHRVGFSVRSVDGIETSEWWREGSGGGGGRVVQLGRGAARTILPALDLSRLAGSLTERAEPPRT